MPSRWAALRGRYYVHLVQMHGPFPNLVRVPPPLFAGLSCKSMAFCKTRYGTREHKSGCSWADRRGALAINGRMRQYGCLGGYAYVYPYWEHL